MNRLLHCLALWMTLESPSVTMRQLKLCIIGDQRVRVVVYGLLMGQQALNML